MAGCAGVSTSSLSLREAPHTVPQSLRYAYIRVVLLLIAQLPLLHASPLSRWTPMREKRAPAEEEPLPTDDATLWIYLAVAIALVLLGGAFAGLTIALMGQDEIYLQVIKTSGEGAERKNATSVLRLLRRGKHWVLVTLLLGNVITNETLPIILDRSLGGGWPAVLGSTVLIVIFGEIIPQSICVRYGLPIGAWMSPLVLILMYLLGPVAWPTAKLLDRLLGEDHGTVYKKAGLKTLVTLHKSLGQAGEQLNEDEVTIISAVLDLKAKSVGSIMTPMDDVFTMSADTVLDEKTMEIILSAGYSRIPIHSEDNEENFVGMLLVKILITYDPEDCKKVRDFALATLPETRPETSCLDIVNFFQEGKSHMVLVSEYPGDDNGALGVVTLEDVIEELIGEEIIDESDVFIDVHKAIKRLTPAPKYRVPKGEIVTETHESLIDVDDTLNESGLAKKHARRASKESATLKVNGGPGDLASPPNSATNLRRTSSTQNAADRDANLKKSITREHLKHLGPSNRASRPKTTRYNTVKIKPGPGSTAEVVIEESSKPTTSSNYTDEVPSNLDGAAPQGGVGAGLVSSAGKDASDGVLALQQGYGSMSPPTAAISSARLGERSPLLERSPAQGGKDSESLRPDVTPMQRGEAAGYHSRSHTGGSQRSTGGGSASGGSPYLVASRAAAAARSGSITENIVDHGGIRKTILELTSSGSDEHEGESAVDGRDTTHQSNMLSPEGESEQVSVKRKKKRSRPKSDKGADSIIDTAGGSGDGSRSGAGRDAK